MKIPFVSLTREQKIVEKDLLKAYVKVTSSSLYIMGPELCKFEEEWAKYCRVKFAFGVGNGTDALIIALKSIGVQKGDEVILPAFTFVATSFAVSHVGAKPVLVDVEKETHAIDPELIKKAITKNTKAIIPVHLYGNIANMQSIKKIAQSHKLFIIEDAAQAHGATYHGKKAGYFGDIATYSFYPAKNLGALGDAGVIVTNNKKIAEQVCLYRNYGQKNKYFSDLVGYNSRLDELQAAFLRIKLKKLDFFNFKRRKLAKYFRKQLAGFVELPKETSGCVSSHHLFTIQIPNRDKVIVKLKKLGVESLIHYPVPIHLQKAYKNLGYKKGDFPISENIAAKTLSLPFFSLMSEKEAKFVSNSLKKVL